MEVRQHIVDDVDTDEQDISEIAATLFGQVRHSLGSADAVDRLSAMRILVLGVERLERHAVRDAQAAGLTWADIGEVYGVSRQAVHRRFADETVVPSDFFDELLSDLDAPGVPVPALARAARRARRNAPAP